MPRFTKHSKTILVVDDEVGPREAIRMILQGKYNVLTCENPQEALDIISYGRVDILLLDIKMPKIDGLKLLKAVKAIAPDVEVVLITAYPTTQGAIEALRNDAYDYIIKPFDKEKIEQAVRKGIIRHTQKRLIKDMSSNLLCGFYQRFSHKKQ